MLSSQPNLLFMMTDQQRGDCLGCDGHGHGQTSIRTDYPHTLPGELAKAGYHTQAIGKNHFTPYRAINGYHNCILDESGRLDDSDYLR